MKSRRRETWSGRVKGRFQYRLISLMAIMCVIALGAGWYGNRLRAAAAQERAMEQLAKKGACIALYQEGAYIQFGRPAGGLCGTGLIKVVGPQQSTVSFV